MRPEAAARSVHAITITRPRTVELLPIHPPSEPLPADYVEGSTVASLVSPGTELNQYFDPAEGSHVDYPLVPGYAAVFAVENVGHRVSTIERGDLALAFFGGHQSYQRHPAAHIVRVPNGLPASIAVFARMMAISMATLSTTAARPPGKVGISGLGLVGHLAAKQFAAAGYQVVAWDPEPDRREALSGPGITVLDRAPIDETIARDDPAGSGELQLVVECSGHEQAVLDSCAAVRKGGEVALVGAPWRPRSETPVFALLRTIFHRYVIVRSGWEWEIPLNPIDFRSASTVGNIEGAMRWLVDGRVDVSGLATVVGPHQADETYAALHARRWPTLSATFMWDGGASEPVVSFDPAKTRELGTIAATTWQEATDSQ
jgi:NADPH:quinone reductase-like Zn-dependent oxidoreductase